MFQIKHFSRTVAQLGLAHYLGVVEVGSSNLLSPNNSPLGFLGENLYLNIYSRNTSKVGYKLPISPVGLTNYLRNIPWRILDAVFSES